MPKKLTAALRNCKTAAVPFPVHLLLAVAERLQEAQEVIDKPELVQEKLREIEFILYVPFQPPVPESQRFIGYDFGGPIPAIPFADFQQMWHRRRENKAIAPSDFKRAAASFRIALLDAFVKQGVVKESDAALRVAASFPFELREPTTATGTLNDCFDVQGFVRQVDATAATKD